MGSVGHTDSTDSNLEREAVVGVLLCSANAATLPARPWPLVAACQMLANELPAGSRHIVTIQAALSSLTGERAVEAWLRRLVGSGAFHTSGRGSKAQWVADHDWLAGWRLISGLMDDKERAAWARAGQVLATTLDRWRKAASAA